MQASSRTRSQKTTTYESTRSTRPSSTSIGSQPDPVFFTDRDLGRAFAEILRAAGVKVEVHDDHFSEKTSDPEWLAETARRGWVAITKNRRIRYTNEEKQTVIDAGARLLVVIGKAPHSELAQNFINTLPKIRAFLAGRPGPFIAKVYRPSPETAGQRQGTVKHWFPKEA